MLYRNSIGTAAFLALALAATGCSQRGDNASPAPRRGADAAATDTGSAGGRRATPGGAGHPPLLTLAPRLCLRPYS